MVFNHNNALQAQHSTATLSRSNRHQSLWQPAAVHSTSYHGTVTVDVKSPIQYWLHDNVPRNRLCYGDTFCNLHSAASVQYIYILQMLS